MRPYETADGVAVLPAYRDYLTLRKQLIKEWKNKLLRLSPEGFQKVKEATEKALREQPGSLHVRVRWELLLEVEQG